MHLPRPSTTLNFSQQAKILKQSQNDSRRSLYDTRNLVESSLLRDKLAIYLAGSLGPAPNLGRQNVKVLLYLHSEMLTPKHHIIWII